MMKAETLSKSMKKYEEKSKILLDHKVTTQMIMIKKYIKIKFNSDDDLPLKKRTKII